MSYSNTSSQKFIGEIQIEGQVNGKLQKLALQLSDNIPPEIQVDNFLYEYNLGNELKD